MTQGTLISYAELEKLGWPKSLIEDYQGLKLDITPQRGAETNPNTIYKANSNGFYVDTTTPSLWFNPTPGELTGWIQL